MDQILSPAKFLAYLLFWYFSSSIKNTIVKKILLVYPHPITTTLTTFLVVACFSWIYIISHGSYKMELAMFRRIIPVAFTGILGHIFTQYSLSRVSVSFTHTVKATGPIFTMIIAYIFLKKSITLPMIGSILPIVIGVSLCTATEISFSWAGFIMAFISTLLFSCQNIITKSLFGKQGDKYKFLAYYSTFSFLLLFPVWAVFEAPILLNQENELYTLSSLALLAGFFSFTQSFSSMSILELVTPITYSIANTFKRIFVIGTSILYFGNVVSPLNYLGIAIAIFGVGIYSRIKQIAEQQHRFSKHGKKGTLIL
eukprot:TRINITY_DN7989_c0_g1_i1.p1 TRINITY_DN7989_c0_g1~~TRINITY_DN7989_c0_g1_i1.p1  ORF type:complete len:312 (-),score=18.73 TRINITY_DN7989_c0_g1_i1:39-974(-)